MDLVGKLLDKIKPSPTLVIAKQATKMKKDGIDVISLSQGEPDFPTPGHICEAGKLAIDIGVTRYTDVDGLSELKEAVARKLLRDNKLSYSIDEIIIGTGGKQVIFNALLASLDVGDEVIIPAPYWVSYPDMVKLAGGTPIFVKCDANQDFKLSPEQLSSVISSKTKWIILNSPSNPTGAGYSKNELILLGKELLKFPNVHVMTDDIYEHIYYDDWQFNNIATVFPEIFSRVLVINGVSKAYSMTGWRIGYAAGPKNLVKAMATIQSQSTSNPCSIAQMAALTALDGPMDFLAERNAAFLERRNLCLDRLNKMQGVSCRKPEGAFYLFASCKELYGLKTPSGEALFNDVDVCQYFLNQAHVAVVPGSAFGLEGYFRVSFAASMDTLMEACDRIHSAIKMLT